jgi:flavodoxin
MMVQALMHLASEKPIGVERLLILGTDAMKKISKDEWQAQPNAATRRILVAYFSWSGNTREIANQIHESVGGDLHEIVCMEPYPSDYDECVKKAGQELEQGYMPVLKSEIENIGSYGVVFIGYPNWWGTIPRPVASFLSQCDSSGRTVIPFCTHGGGRLGRSVTDIAKLCPKSTILDALAVREGEVRRAQSRVSDWLRRIGMTE